MTADSNTPLPDLTPSLVARLRAGDDRAGELLDRLYRSAMIRFCYGYLGRVQDAEDAVQEIFFNVLKASAAPERFRPWLYRVARNHCLNILRSRARNPAELPLPPASAVAADLTGALTALVRQENRGQLAGLIAGLPPETAELLRLRYAEGLSRDEVAEVVGLDEPTVKSRLYEGLAKLRRRAVGG